MYFEFSFLYKITWGRLLVLKKLNLRGRDLRDETKFESRRSLSNMRLNCNYDVLERASLSNNYECRLTH